MLDNNLCVLGKYHSLIKHKDLHLLHHCYPLLKVVIERKTPCTMETMALGDNACKYDRLKGRFWTTIIAD